MSGPKRAIVSRALKGNKEAIALLNAVEETKKCFYCDDPIGNYGEKLKLRTMDHIIPRSSGRVHKLLAACNYVVACHVCNCQRGNSDFIEFAIKTYLRLKYEKKNRAINA